MKALKITGIIAGILIAGLITISLSIDGIVKSQLEQNMSTLMQTEVEIGDVNISLFSGNSGIEGIAVKNPVGFSSGNAIYLDELKMKLHLMSLFEDQIIVNELLIGAPDLLVEQEGAGVNLRTLMNNMDSDSDTGGQRSEKGLIIERLIVENGSIEVVTNIDKERTTTASIDRFELTGIGRNGSNTLQQSIRQIMTPILEEALAEALKQGAVDQLKDAAKELLGG